MISIAHQEVEKAVREVVLVRVVKEVEKMEACLIEEGVVRVHPASQEEKVESC